MVILDVKVYEEAMGMKEMKGKKMIMCGWCRLL